MRRVWVLLFAAVLYGWGITGGATHFYYRAAVRSMASDWRAFLFGSLDFDGSITIDKAPGGLWPQALLVRMFGFHDVVLLVPGAVAAAVTVWLLYAAVRRWAGERAGVVAAVVLALTPAVFAAARVNIGDPVLVLCLVAAAYAMVRAAESVHLRWPVLAGALLGAGFLVKMLQAWLLLPVFCAVVLAGAEPLRRRVLRGGLLVAACAMVSLSWVTVVSLVPARSRPYVDGSAANSVWEMVFVYNGFGRGADAAAPTVPFGGPPGPTRLFGPQLGGQIGWLLPAALVLGVGGVVATWRCRQTRPGWLLWGGWFAVATVVFSVLPGLHPYYAATLAPAVAALIGAGVRWADRRLLVLGGVLSAGVAVIVIGRAHLAWGIGLCAVVVAAACCAVFVRARAFAAALAIAGLAAPAMWIATTPRYPGNAFITTNPVAGPYSPAAVYGTAVTTPALSMMTGAPPGGPVPAFDAPMAGSAAEPGLLEFLRSRQSGRYLFATSVASMAAPYLAEGYHVLPMGGFTGMAPFPEPAQLGALVDRGELRYVLDIPMPGPRSAWLAAHCGRVDPAAYGRGAGFATLYDCAGP